MRDSSGVAVQPMGARRARTRRRMVASIAPALEPMWRGERSAPDSLCAAEQQINREVFGLG